MGVNTSCTMIDLYNQIVLPGMVPKICLGLTKKPWSCFGDPEYLGEGSDSTGSSI